MKRIKSPWHDKEKTHDPCVFLERSLLHFMHGNIGESVKLWWQVACTNIAMIPRLILWEEIPELGDDLDQDEAWFYMNTKWKDWKEEKKALVALSLFWSHWSIRKALGLPLVRKRGIPSAAGGPDLQSLADYIGVTLKENSEASRFAMKAAGMRYDIICFIRSVDKKGITPPSEVLEVITEIETFSANTLELLAIESPDKKMLSQLAIDFNEMDEIQKETRAGFLETYGLIKKNLGNEPGYIS